MASEPSTGTLRGFRSELPARTAQIHLAEDQTDATELVNAVREAIMGIMIAVVIVAGLKLPLLTGWLQTGWMVNRASLLGVLRHPLVAVRRVLK